MGAIKPGDSVVVFGAGPVGLMAAKCAWLFGAGRVIEVDHIDYRLEFAKTFAGAETYNFHEGDPVLFIKKSTDWLGADVCIDAVGCEAAGSLTQTVISRVLKMAGGAAL